MPGSEGMEDIRSESTSEKVTQMEYTYPKAEHPLCRVYSGKDHVQVSGILPEKRGRSLQLFSSIVWH